MKPWSLTKERWFALLGLLVCSYIRWRILVVASICVGKDGVELKGKVFDLLGDLQSYLYDTEQWCYTL